ncbi:hypothetical protein R1sor_005174 [Riccia sorocarpa]|uniref:Histone-binding protein RBBP4-like N-terminal domain-containing protein n=1 Tax=Riccia sorocarpa TaxID=122646 RepID=A0ABD3HJA9_9MARC
MRREERYSQWKSLVPVLYDWLANHSLMWPSLSCRWGPQLEQGTYKSRQRIYLSEQTDGSYPNTLVVYNCEVIKPRTAAAEHISHFGEQGRSPFVKKHKTIIHPGEVNRIRELPQNSKIVATHTDSREVYIWNLETQPNRATLIGATHSRPDLVLEGHTENAEFALAMNPTSPLVLSGGKDAKVILWSIEDQLTAKKEVSSSKTSAALSGGKHVGSSAGSASISEKSAQTCPSTIGPLGIFSGHSATVEDVQFRPSSSKEFCSVGDDSSLIFWDARTGTSPAMKVEKAHDADLHCVDWNLHDENYVLTGSADTSIKLFDRRKLSQDGSGSQVETFNGHTAPVLCVQWCPDRGSVFGSSAEDGLLNIWDHVKVNKPEEESYRRMKGNTPPPGLLFQHAGHRDKVVDFHWDSCNPWTVMSVSDDCNTPGGGGTLQIWRMNDMIYRPEDEVLAELASAFPSTNNHSAATTA